MSAARHLTRHLKEIRIHLCQTSSASAGVREYITNNYKVLKSANPEFPILIRECSGIQVIFMGFRFILRVVHAQVILFLKSMLERVGSDIKRL